MIALALLLGACTKENKDFCCTSADDCATVGSSDIRECDNGLTCVNHFCAAQSCEFSGCAAAAPYCDLNLDVCVGCSDSADCSRFPATSVCEPTDGSCVECNVADDCTESKPVCANHACRACELDSECPSGACSDDGKCIAEASVVYVAAQGVDALPCSKTQPCYALDFAIQQTNPTRPHIVVAPGSYTLATRPFYVDSQATSALRVFVHGGGAHIQGGSGDGFLMLQLPISFKNIEIINTNASDGAALNVQGSADLTNVELRGLDALRVSGVVTAKNLTLRGIRYGLENSGSTTIDRGLVEGGSVGISGNGGSLQLTNLLVTGSSGLGIDVRGTTGSVSFSTVTDTGNGISGTAGVRCLSANLTFRSSIVWARTISNRPVAEGSCAFVVTIVGPVGIAGALNMDPLFVSPAMHDFHLSGGSPAKDLVDQGPGLDRDGDKRPIGPRYDIGADEAQ